MMALSLQSDSADDSMVLVNEEIECNIWEEE